MRIYARQNNETEVKGRYEFREVHYDRREGISIGLYHSELVKTLKQNGLFENIRWMEIFVPGGYSNKLELRVCWHNFVDRIPITLNHDEMISLLRHVAISQIKTGAA